MKNTFGQSMSVTIYGESHGEFIGAVIDGMSPGLEIDTGYIDKRLAKRRPSGAISTSRVEADKYVIASGVFNGKTTGTPISIIIPNENKRSKDYNYGVARPSHADYAGYCKYHGNEDYRGGGHFSGRITAAVVAAGAVCMQALDKKGIKLATAIKSIGDVSGRGFDNIENDIKTVDTLAFPALANGEQMIAEIESAKADGDSIGGVLETAVIGMPAGVGEPFFDSCESMLAHALFSVPAVKGVEFGKGFEITALRGGVANDTMSVKDGKVVSDTNNSGGINGGITNGMPIIFRTAIKPTPTIFKEQATVNFLNNENAKISPTGRHDPCIVHRAAEVINAVSAITLCDLLITRFGTDFFGE